MSEVLLNANFVDEKESSDEGLELHPMFLSCTFELWPIHCKAFQMYGQDIVNAWHS